MERHLTTVASDHVMGSIADDYEVNPSSFQHSRVHVSGNREHVVLTKGAPDQRNERLSPLTSKLEIKAYRKCLIKITTVLDPRKRFPKGTCTPFSSRTGSDAASESCPRVGIAFSSNGAM